MAWEARNGGRYYYRKRRQVGQVHSEYIGAGEIGDLIARLDDLTRQQRELEQEELRSLLGVEAELDREIAALAERVQRLTAAVLLASGCHRPRRQWRVRRVKE